MMAMPPPPDVVVDASKSQLVELGKLVDDRDPELDFFENLIHIQTHRRPRALTRLAKMLEAKAIGYQVITR